MKEVYYELLNQGRTKEALNMARYEWDQLHRVNPTVVDPLNDFCLEDIVPVLMNEPETASREFALYTLALVE